MTSTIDQAFIEEYNADVHLLYRQYGSRLMNTTRKGTVAAKSVYFQNSELWQRNLKPVCRAYVSRSSA